MSYWNKTELRTGSMWCSLPTIRNGQKIKKWFLVEHKRLGRRGGHTIQQIQKGTGIDKKTLRATLLIMTQLKKPILRWDARIIYRGEKVQILQVLRLTKG